MSSVCVFSVLILLYEKCDKFSYGIGLYTHLLTHGALNSQYKPGIDTFIFEWTINGKFGIACGVVPNKIWYKEIYHIFNQPHTGNLKVKSLGSVYAKN